MKRLGTQVFFQSAPIFKKERKKEDQKPGSLRLHENVLVVCIAQEGEEVQCPRQEDVLEQIEWICLRAKANDFLKAVG